MTLAKRYRILSFVVWAQSALCLLFGAYVLVSRKRQFPLNVTVNEVQPFNGEVLNAITSRPPPFAESPLPAPVVGGGDSAKGGVRDFSALSPSPLLPVVFDRFGIVDGRACAFVGNRAVFTGDRLLGRSVESVDLAGVMIDGRIYTYRERNNYGHIGNDAHSSD